MSLEAITKIRAVEEAMEKSKADARAQAQKMVADAERDGRALLQQGKEAAAKAAAEAMGRAEQAAAGRREEILARCDEFDAKLLAEAQNKGGEDYALIVSAAYRQTIAAHKLVADLDGTPLFISKENDSNGCIGTLDVTYPSIPLFLKYNPELVLGMLRPIIKFAQSDAWKYEFTPHDVGQYPLANGQVYGLNKETGELKEHMQMPVEECGNMLLMAAALLTCEKRPGLMMPHMDTLKTWAKYLLKYESVCNFTCKSTGMSV